MEYQISFKRAREILLPFGEPRRTETVKLIDAYGRVLARDVLAVESAPSFDCSLIDGYAVSSDDCADAPATLRMSGEVSVGQAITEPLPRGGAIKLHDGAMLPTGADSVVSVSDVLYAYPNVTVIKQMKPGMNISRHGSIRRSGDVIAVRGTVVTPELTAAFASQGILELEVYLTPVIGIISTGAELVPSDSGAPAVGKKRDSNRHALEVAIRALGCETFFLGIDVEDDTQAIADLINRGRGLDAMISTGGTGGGERDYMPSAFDAMGAFTLTWSGSFKPCGSFAFATLGITPLIALPGDTSNALMLFRAIVAPLLRKMRGLPNPYNETLPARLEGRAIAAGEFMELVPCTLSIATGEAIATPTDGIYDALALIEPGRVANIGDSVSVLQV
ncbi:MAG: molybdopterin molybdotransferase MoeA [Oscillospiraceae bacterium]|jgi:molybdopterin molybdotransferase|nr:molybdopterin molybdotransferase MoeA [Oscillospiraceae bacterium]